jgi:curved DNA-binding protein CbpA
MNYYERLGIAPGCGFSEIKKAWYKKVKECHPDLHNNSPVKEEEFKRLAEAFDTLSDPVKRKIYDEKLGAGASSTQRLAEDAPKPEGPSIMDSPADDTLEELIVGNNPPPWTTLSTLFLDMERTEIFIEFREAKSLFHLGRFAAAAVILRGIVARSPHNILHRYYLGKALAAKGDFGGAVTHFKAAVRIGSRRSPPQRLQKIRVELDRARKKRSPLLYKITEFFAPPPPAGTLPPDERMIEETNRSMARIQAGRTKKNRKLLR